MVPLIKGIGERLSQQPLGRGLGGALVQPLLESVKNWASVFCSHLPDGIGLQPTGPGLFFQAIELLDVGKGGTS